MNMLSDADVNLIEQEEQILRAALEAIEDPDRVKVCDWQMLQERPRRDHGADAEVMLEVRGERITYLLEVVQRVSRSRLIMELQRQQRATSSMGKPRMIATVCMSEEQALWCRANQLAFIDTAGNRFISTERYETAIVGMRLSEEIKQQFAPAAKAGSTAYLKVIFPLLCDRNLISAPYRDLARLSGASIGTISDAFEVLKKRSIVGERQRDRVWLDQPRLFQEWVVGYASKLRPKMRPRRFATDSDALWREAPDLPEGLLWGGEVAAERTSDLLHAGEGTLYFDPSLGKDHLRKLMMAYRFKADPNGNIEVMETFWPYAEALDSPIRGEVGLTPHVVTYADLMATNSSRNWEAAQAILEKYIDRAFHPR
ncbi:type IV toxin-antitoxin system AbiEi family antitoxin [Chitinolyticbacter albus]|uniref:type IV toxin-antitoxin system AbiEi family antitoxin n=1 Tax=Chitinolyticbacter albus TaxID=2961951 RepID=UPI00210BBCE3|nr:type IV toxin-antitoxin system AbiEi family antitoxin [Chitinolyticbacter albus]